jgi:hypothetical protein
MPQEECNKLCQVARGQRWKVLNTGTTDTGFSSSRGRNNCRRASQFQSRNKYEHVIRLVDVDGNVFKVVTRGWLNTTSHQSVLASFSHRAGHPFQTGLTSTSDGYHAWSLDKTGTIMTDKILCAGNKLCLNEVQ